MSDEDLVSKNSNYPLRLTEKEQEFLNQFAEKLKIPKSNLVRRAIKQFAESCGEEIPEGVFSDKPGGNWIKSVGLVA